MGFKQDMVVKVLGKHGTLETKGFSSLKAADKDWDDFPSDSSTPKHTGPLDLSQGAWRLLEQEVYSCPGRGLSSSPSGYRDGGDWETKGTRTDRQERKP